MSNQGSKAGRARRAAGCFSSLAAVVPLTWLVGFTLLVFKARLSTGQWPRPYRPDPGSIGGPLYTMLAGTLPLLYFFGLGALLCLSIALSVPRFNRVLRQAGLRSWHVYVAFLGMAVLVAFVHADPGQLRTWLAD